MGVRSLRRVLVTGGAGFIGSNFTRYLSQREPDLDLWVLDKLTYAGNMANLEDLEGLDNFRFIRGDIADHELVDRLAGDVDAIVNFAAETHVDRSLLEPYSFIRSDVLGTAVLCEAACNHGHEVLLHVSTDEVYGDVARGRSSESDAFRPRSPYSASKAGGEHVAFAYAASHGLPLLVTRGANTYGPYQYPEKVVPLFVTNALDGLPLPLYGDGSAVRDYLYVLDHCDAIYRVLSSGTPGRAYNVGTEVETSGVDLATRLLAITGKPESLMKFVEDRPGHDYRYSVDTTRLRSELGWEPTVSLQQGLEETVSWYREHEAWWRPLKSEEYWAHYRRVYTFRDS